MLSRLLLLMFFAVALGVKTFAGMDVEFINPPSSVMFVKSSDGNVGIGTAVPGSRLSVAGGVGIGTGMNTIYVTGIAPAGGLMVQGNIGIGTITTDGGNLLVMGGGNVGIGSSWPGVTVDVQGDIRASGTITGALGIGWTDFGGNIYTSNLASNVGVGTSTPQTSLAITHGNMGIGTWTTAGGSLIIIGGNVGISSIAPGNPLDVGGTMRMTGFIMPTGAVNGGFMISDASGNGSWGAFSGAALSGLTTNSLSKAGSATTINDSVLVQNSGTNNIGLGTTTAQASFVVLNGNMGIGTWTAANPLSIVGNMGIGTVLAPPSGLAVMSNVGIGTWTGVNSTTTNLLVFGAASVGSAAFASATAPANGLIVSGNVGVVSTAPGAALDVGAKMRITNSGHFVVTGSPPTISSCGGGSSVAARSTDIAGTVTTQAAPCTLNFANAWRKAPYCIASNTSEVNEVNVSTTTTQVTFSSHTAGTTINFICFGNE